MYVKGRSGSLRLEWRLPDRPASEHDHVPCRRCGAAVGQPCRTSTGREPYYTHAMRVRDGEQQ